MYLDSSKLDKFLSKKNIELEKENILSELNEVVEKFLSEKLKTINNKNRIEDNDNKKDQLPALSVLTRAQIEKLPDWIVDDIENCHIVGPSKKVIKTPKGLKYHLGNPLNDLPGNKWTFFLNSVLSTRYPASGPESYAHHIRKIHPSPKPPQLMRDLIEFFTKEQEIVLDYFMGVGGSLLGASLCNRRAIGIDLEKRYIETYKEASKYLDLNIQKTILGDSLKILENGKLAKELKGEKVSLVLIDPPYGDMMAREKTGEAVKQNKPTAATPFTSLKEDLGNMEWETFRKVFKGSVESSLKCLKNNGHVIVFIKDMQPTKSSPNLLHADVINDLSSISNLNYIGTKIWADLGVNLYPYGYPYSFVSNQIHQYIMIFKYVNQA